MIKKKRLAAGLGGMEKTLKRRLTYRRSKGSVRKGVHN